VSLVFEVRLQCVQKPDGLFMLLRLMKSRYRSMSIAALRAAAREACRKNLRAFMTKAVKSLGQAAIGVAMPIQTLVPLQ
jgi:hypothetical protein